MSIPTLRNKAHTLPYFLTLLGEQDYPKDRVKLWIRTDHNEDASAEILKLWTGAFGHLYNSVDFKVIKLLFLATRFGIIPVFRHKDSSSGIICRIQ